MRTIFFLTIYNLLFGLYTSESTHMSRQFLHFLNNVKFTDLRLIFDSFLRSLHGVDVYNA